MYQIKGYEQKKCIYCNSPIVRKNGRRKGLQRYICYACKKSFTGGEKLEVEKLWRLYTQGKYTYKDLSDRFKVSESTIKRRIKEVKVTFNLGLSPRRVVGLMDTTYWGRSWGLLVIKDALSGKILWIKYIKQERLSYYKEGVEYLEQIGFVFDGIVCDGLKGMFQQFESYKVQMCQFHQVAIIRRYITNNPKLEAGKELKQLSKLLTRTDKESFIAAFDSWHDKWDVFLKERSVDPVTGKSRYVHKKLRSAYLSLKRNLPYLFVWYDNPELHIPNTNNALEGLFTELKNKLRNHNGMSKENRKRFIDEFFLGIQGSNKM